MSPSTVLAWIDRGLLPAHRTPGGHRRVQHGALLAFLERHSLPIPARLRATRSVLLVGFDEDTARALELRAPEVEVHIATDMVDGLFKLGACQPDAVVLDGDREHLGDPDLIRRIRAEPKTAAVLIVVVAAIFVAAERSSPFRQAGASACLSKPLEIDALALTLGSSDANP